MLKVLKNSTYVQAKKSAIIKNWSNEKEISFSLNEKCKCLKKIIKEKFLKH